jgi:BirA family biotin operon repressor/biotin-[acetyl-CoA-carboxylase] ligase
MGNSGATMNEQLLDYFITYPDQFISGEKLSKTMGCSRTAVWKHIESLRKAGYRFEAIPRLGYKLMQQPELLRMASLLSKLRTTILGRSIRLYDQVESTQNVAHELVKEGAPEGTLVLAEEQLAGRGRMGRKWHSPKGKGIWMSLVLKPHIPLQFTPQLTLLVAVALCRSIRQKTSLEVGIKWPNDLLVQGRKISGILLESSADDERLHYVIAGIGISVNLTAQDFPEELRSKATSLLIETGREIDRTELICDFLEQLEALYELYQQQGFAPVRLLWEALTVSLHHPITVQTANGLVEGIAHGIDDMGALQVVLTNGESMKLYSGDVQY